MFVDLHEGILEEFADRQSWHDESPRDAGLTVIRPETREEHAATQAAWRALNVTAASDADRAKYAAIKADPERLARRREVARASAEKKRRALGVPTTRGRPRKID